MEKCVNPLYSFKILVCDLYIKVATVCVEVILLGAVCSLAHDTNRDGNLRPL